MSDDLQDVTSEDETVTEATDIQTDEFIAGNDDPDSFEDGIETVTRTVTTYNYYSYDIRGSVTRVTDATGTTVAAYSYSTYGKRTALYGDENNDSPLGYCARDTLTYPDGTTATYTYDKNGNIKTVTDWNGNVTSCSYDAESNLTEKKEYASDSVVSDTKYVYDADERLTEESELISGLRL